MPKNRTERIRAAAFESGFDTVGFSPATLPKAIGENLKSFLDAGRHGDMTWLKDRAEIRIDPKHLWPETKSVIVVGVNYGPDHDPLTALDSPDTGTISVYAQNKDYHDVAKKNLKRLARRIVETEGGELKVFVDTAPVMEKPLAAQAGIGWQGKHTNVVSREFGSWLFLGAIYFTLDLAHDAPADNHCGICQNCLDVCPTKAFPAPYQLDAKRCISYLTIEHKGPIPAPLRKAIGNRIYGCDDCLAVCPWNKFASVAKDTAYHARQELISPNLADLANLDDQEFRLMFSKSPIKRTGRIRFIRNVLIAIGNSQNATHLPAVRKLLNDESALVRGAAVWALGELAPTHEFERCRNQYAPQETDSDVASEWKNASADYASTVT